MLLFNHAGKPDANEPETNPVRSNWKKHWEMSLPMACAGHWHVEHIYDKTVKGPFCTHSAFFFLLLVMSSVHKNTYYCPDYKTKISVNVQRSSSQPFVF